MNREQQKTLLLKALMSKMVITDAWAKESGIGRLSARVKEQRERFKESNNFRINTLKKYDGAYCGYQLERLRNKPLKVSEYARDENGHIKTRKE